MNYLNGIRCLYNTDTLSVVEIDTDYGHKILKLPYKEIESQKGNRYEYAMGVKNYCKVLGIDYKDYFGIQHKDCE